MKSLRTRSMNCLSNAIVMIALTVAHAQAQTPEAAALDLIRAGDWEGAAAAFEEVVRANPYNGVSFYYLGAAYERLGQCEKAIPVLEKALELGAGGRRTPMRQAHYFVAKCAAASGRAGLSFEHIYEAWKSWGFRDFSPTQEEPAFAALRKEPRYQALVQLALPLDSEDAGERAAADLVYFDKLIRETHPDPFHAITEEDWDAAIETFRGRIPRMSADEVAGAFMRLGALVGDGHTAVYPPIEGPAAWSLVPIWPLWLQDGWYVGAAAPEYVDLVGGRLLAAGDVAFDELFGRARQYLARDNQMTALWLGQLVLQMPQFYALEGAAPSSEAVTFTVEALDGAKRRVTVAAQAPDRNPNAHFAPADWPTMTSIEASPRWIRYAHQTFAIDYFPDQKTLYVVLNNVFNTDEQSLADFGEQVRLELERLRASALILDLRLNNGGDGNLRWDLLSELMAYAPLREEGHFYVLTGPRSFSATMMLVGDLETRFGATFVGMPTGGRPVTLSTETPFTLPNTGLSGSISARPHIDGQSADDRRPFFPPDIVVWPTGEDLRAGRDPVLDAALAAAAESSGES